MAFHELAPDVFIETYYMNSDRCKNYNEFYGYSEMDSDYIREGYYYGNNLIGPFLSEKDAILHARSERNL